MKVDRLETHDRLISLHKDQALNLSQGASDCLSKNPDSIVLQQHSPYVYIFAHPRTAEDGITKRMLWQPRLTKPEPQTNSYLFRGQSGTDILEICWLLPPREVWNQYNDGNVTESQIVQWSINQFVNNREDLARKHPDDLPDWRVQLIYEFILKNKGK